MKKVLTLAVGLSLIASLALAQTQEEKRKAALLKYQALAPTVTVVGGTSVTALTLSALLVLIAALTAGSSSATPQT